MKRPAHILLVDDNRADVDLMKEGLKQSKLSHVLSVVMDGEEAMGFLQRKGKYASATTPDLVLLDLNLPKKDGREVLAEIKGDPSLKQIPVVVLSGSEAETDIRAAYKLGANCYLTKPFSLDQLLAMVNSLAEFWFSVATLPPKDH